MAGSVTLTYSETRTIKKVVWDWTSDASGDVSGTDTVTLSGQIMRVVFKPDSGGTQPTDLYDIVINDEEGVDVLAGLGANLSNSTASQVVPILTNGTDGNSSPMVIDGKLSLVVSNAGNAKGGEVHMYMR